MGKRTVTTGITSCGGVLRVSSPLFLFLYQMEGKKAPSSPAAPCAHSCFFFLLTPLFGGGCSQSRVLFGGGKGLRSSGSRGIFGYGPFLRVAWHLVFTTTSPKKVQRARHCNLRIMTALWFRQNFHLKSQKKFEQSWELW